MSRTLIPATVLSIRDFSFYYPYCVICYRKIIKNNDSRRWRCSYCNIDIDEANLSYRYRLALTIAEDETVCAVTVFGKCLEIFFGVSANDFQRFVTSTYNDFQKAGFSQVTEIICSTVKNTFVGSMFIFGFNVSNEVFKNASLKTKLVNLCTVANKENYLIATQIINPIVHTVKASIYNLVKRKLTLGGFGKKTSIFTSTNLTPEIDEVSNEEELDNSLVCTILPNLSNSFISSKNSLSTLNSDNESAESFSHETTLTCLSVENNAPSLKRISLNYKKSSSDNCMDIINDQNSFDRVYQQSNNLHDGSKSRHFIKSSQMFNHHSENLENDSSKSPFAMGKKSLLGNSSQIELQNLYFHKNELNLGHTDNCYSDPENITSYALDDQRETNHYLTNSINVEFSDKNFTDIFTFEAQNVEFEPPFSENLDDFLNKCQEKCDSIKGETEKIKSKCDILNCGSAKLLKAKCLEGINFIGASYNLDCNTKSHLFSLNRSEKNGKYHSTEDSAMLNIHNYSNDLFSDSERSKTQRSNSKSSDSLSEYSKELSENSSQSTVKQSTILNFNDQCINEFSNSHSVNSVNNVEVNDIFSQDLFGSSQPLNVISQNTFLCSTPLIASGKNSTYNASKSLFSEDIYNASRSPNLNYSDDLFCDNSSNNKSSKNISLLYSFDLFCSRSQS